MRKKEMIMNYCQMCEYSAKEYLCIKNKFILIKASFCMNSDLSERERKKRLKNKIKCEHFAPAQTGKEEQLSNINTIISEMSKQLTTITNMLSELEEKEH